MAQGRHRRPCGRRARATVDPDGVGTKAACWFTFEVAAGAEVEVRLRLQHRGARPTSGPASSGSWTAGGARPTTFHESFVAGRRHRRGGHDHAAGLRRPAVEPAVLPLRRRPLARRRPRPAAPPPERRARPQRGLAPPRRQRRHPHARHVGVPVVRLVGPGLPLRDHGPPRPGRGQATAPPAAAGSGTPTRTASCRPTSGSSPTPTRRCTRGPRCGCSRSTARPTSTSWPGCSTSC